MTTDRYRRELLQREAAIRAASRSTNPTDRENADRLRRLRLAAELQPASGPLPLFPEEKT
ncbi:MAG TPA: hypothetical protein VFB81_01620 [Myxococcales bacterium]|nr:hypothetical protein [Myxococcales bacterium]